MKASHENGFRFVSVRKRGSSKSRGFSEENYSFLVYSIPFVLSVLCYSNILNGDFVHDDVFAIVNNPDVSGEGNLSDVWFHDYWGEPIANVKSHKSYRPLTTLSFRLDYYLSQGCPTWFHIVNVCLHACVTCIMAHVCMHVLHTSLLTTLLASSLFAVHPIHTEAVSGIVGRADILAALFFLLSLIAYSRCVVAQDCPAIDQNANHVSRRQHDHSPWLPSATLVLSLLLAVTSSLCKETGFTVLGVCFLYDVIKHGRQILRLESGSLDQCLRPMCARLLSLGLTAVVFLGFRLYIMDFQQPDFPHEANPASFSDSMLTRVLTFNYLLPFNLWLLLCPRVLCYDWQVGSIPLVESLGDDRNLHTLAFYLMALGLVLRSWRTFVEVKESKDSHTTYKQRSSRQILPLALVLLCVPFLPATNLLFRVGFVVAERVLYMPSIGFCVLVSQGVVGLCDSRPKFKGHFLTLAVLLILTLAGRTWRRNPVWASRKALFWSGVKTMPTNAKVHFNMGNFFRDTKDRHQAALHYKRAIELQPNHPSYHNNLGTVLTNQSESEYHYRKALALHPNHKGALVNLGNIMTSQGNPHGIDVIQRALDIDPMFVDAHLSLGKALLFNDQYEAAEEYIQQAIELDPHLPDAHAYYGYLFHHTGRHEHAVREFQHAFTLNSHNTMAMKNAALSLRSLQRYSEAEVLLKRALSIKGDSEIYSILGSLYAEMGQKLNALFAYREALSLSPNNTAINLRYIRALDESNQRSDAERSLANLLTQLPNDLNVLRFAYTFKQQNGMTKKAFFYLEEAIVQARLMNHDCLGKLYYDKADIYRLWADWGNSLKFFNMSIELDPTFIDSYINMGTIFHIQGNYSKAEEFYLKALSLNPVNELVKKNMEKLRTVWRPANKKR